jgi:hypothetical protein
MPALATPAPAPAAAISAEFPTKPADAATMEAARRLSRLLNSEQQQVDAAVRLVDVSFIPAMAADESIKEFEAEYPGLLKRIGDDIKPVFARHTRQVLPRFVERYAAIYAADFSADELNDLYALYASPAGQRLLASMMTNVTMDSLAKEAVANPDSETSLTAIRADHDKSVKTALSQVSAEDKKVFAMLMTKPYYPRMLLVGPKLRKLEQDMINEPDPELDAEIEAAIEKSITEHIAAAEESK